MEKLSILSTSGIINGEDVKVLLRAHEPLINSNSAVERMPLKRRNLSKEKVLEALELANGNKDRASEILEVNRTTLWRRLKKYGI